MGEGGKSRLNTDLIELGVVVRIGSSICKIDRLVRERESEEPGSSQRLDRTREAPPGMGETVFME